MDEDRYDEIPEDEEELSPEENPPEDQPAPIEDQREMLADMQQRAAASIEQPMPADQGETLDDMQPAGEQTPNLEVPELNVEAPELGDGQMPDFRTQYVPNIDDLDMPVPPYRQPPREPPSPLRRIPRPQQQTMADMQGRVQRPPESRSSSYRFGRTQFQTKYEPAQQLPADPIFDDDGLTEGGAAAGQVGEAGARNREADAAYRHDVNQILEASTEMIILQHRDLEQLRMALERYRG